MMNVCIWVAMMGEWGSLFQFKTSNSHLEFNLKGLVMIFFMGFVLVRSVLYIMLRFLPNRGLRIT